MSHEVPIDGVLDLHSFAARDIKSVVEEYTHSAAEVGFEEIRFIHGRGIGVQRSIVHAVLKRHPAVESYRDAAESHMGATIATLATGQIDRR